MERIKIENCTGIYGLYLDEELVYIGKTIQSFSMRYRQHKHFVDFPNDSETQYEMYYELAAALALGRTLQLRPIFVVETARYNSLYTITNRDLESMEFALISMLQPRFNVEGRRKPYRYTC